MRLALGYVFAFTLMTGIIAAAALAIFTLVIGALSFITWSWPLIPINWFSVFRMCIAAGWFIALWFVVSAEGKATAENLAEDFKGKFK